MQWMRFISIFTVFCILETRQKAVMNQEREREEAEMDRRGLADC